MPEAIAEHRVDLNRGRAQPAGQATPWLFIAADLAGLLALPLAGSLLRQTTENLERNLSFWGLLALTTVALAASYGAYRAPQAAQLARHTRLVITCFLAVSLVMLSMSLPLGHAHILARRWTMADLVLTPFMLAVLRGRLSQWLSSAPPCEPARTLVVCFGPCPADLARAAQTAMIPGHTLSVLDLGAPGLLETNAWRTEPRVQSLLRQLHARQIDDVIFVHHAALDWLAAAAAQELLGELLSYPARVWLAFDLGASLPPLLQHRSGACRIVPVMEAAQLSSLNLTKRGFDLAAGAALLALLSPILLACALLVRLGSPGPILFRQLRTGAHGRSFTVLKFRTMTHNPKAAFAQAQRTDQRVTKAGRFLRATSLDELPQLINVLRGEMSLVGPRPHAPETQVEGIGFEDAVRLYRLRHRVKPGMTGLAQIRGQRGATPAIDTLEARLASDIEYIQCWSLWLDVSIMLKTLPAIAGRNNAY